MLRWVGYFMICIVMLEIGCGVASAVLETVLERGDVGGFEVTEHAADGRTVVTIAGTTMFSGMTVKSITEVIRADVLVVIVRVEPRQDGATGSFEHSVLVPNGVNKVAFGSVGEVVWSRRG